MWRALEDAAMLLGAVVRALAVMPYDVTLVRPRRAMVDSGVPFSCSGLPECWEEI
jgi:hypothetical protein